MEKQNLAELEEVLAYRFSDRKLLVRALTHSSRAHEARSEIGATSPRNDPPEQDNERLEFLGDSVLGWMVSDWLFHRFDTFHEGQLSTLKNHLVSANHLVAAAQKLDLGRFLNLGRGEETAGGRTKQRLLVNAFEAILAAVYLDGGAEAARVVFLPRILPTHAELEQLVGTSAPLDYRSELERLVRERNLPRPVYILVEEYGPGHARVFRVEARVGADLKATGEGSSKKIATHNAAHGICDALNQQ